MNAPIMHCRFRLHKKFHPFVWFLYRKTKSSSLIQMIKTNKLQRTERMPSKPAYFQSLPDLMVCDAGEKRLEMTGDLCSDCESGNTITPPAVWPISPPSRPLTYHHHHSPCCSKPPAWLQRASPGVVCDCTSQPFFMQTHHNNESSTPRPFFAPHRVLLKTSPEQYIPHSLACNKPPERHLVLLCWALSLRSIES